MSDSDEVDSLSDRSVEVKPKRKKRKKNKDPNRPKRNMSAFFLYSNAHRARVKGENPDAKFGDIAKLLSAEFKEISEDDKAEWNEKADADKQRYLREMEDYVPPSDDSDSDDGGKKKKKKKKKDPNAPKRNQSAFFLYSNATRADIKAAQPDLAFGQIAKVISVNFKALPAEERAYWDEKAAADKERYQAEMAAYRGEA